MRRGAVAIAPASLPTTLQGIFVDDYNNTYTITAGLWRQHPTQRYRITRVSAADQFAIALNDSTNASDAGRWTRIDWLALDLAPYTWGFCYSSWNAPTAAAAESAQVVHRDTPRTGCNGHPFTRMRRP